MCFTNERAGLAALAAWRQRRGGWADERVGTWARGRVGGWARGWVGRWGSQGGRLLGGASSGLPPSHEETV